MGKTVLLIRNAAAGDFGGAETYQVSLATVLQQKGYDPVIVTRSDKLIAYAATHNARTIRGWWWSKQNWSGKNVILTPVYVLWQTALVVWYTQLIIRTGARVLHIQSKDDFIAATIAGRITSARVIWTDHMDLRYIFMGVAQPLKNPIGKMIFWSARLAHKVIIISDNELRLVTGHFSRQQALAHRIIIVKNGVIDQIQQYNKRSNDTFVFCLASRVTKSKGVGEAIEAFATLKGVLGPLSPVTLNIYGTGPDLDLFEAKASAYKDIVFKGHQIDVLQSISDADVFMLPSYQEGFSIALLEATMLQKPIIATNVDSNPELIIDHETGLLVAPRDPSGLAKAMHILYADAGLRNRVAQAARNQYERSFDLTSIVEARIIPLYEGRDVVS